MWNVLINVLSVFFFIKAMVALSNKKLQCNQTRVGGMVLQVSKSLLSVSIYFLAAQWSSQVFSSFLVFSLVFSLVYSLFVFSNLFAYKAPYISISQLPY